LGYVEIDQEAGSHSREFHVREQLRFVDRHNAINRLKFHDQFAIHEKIDSITTIQKQPFVLYGQGMLSYEGNAGALQLV
jgi:hypothetical protein